MLKPCLRCHHRLSQYLCRGCCRSCARKAGWLPPLAYRRIKAVEDHAHEARQVAAIERQQPAITPTENLELRTAVYHGVEYEIIWAGDGSLPGFRV